MKNIRLFKTEAAFEAAYNGDEYVKPWVSATLTGDSEYRVNYNKTKEEELRGTPLTFEITSDGNVVWKAQQAIYAKTIEYKKNDGEWTSITSTTPGTSISVVSGDTVQFRGNNVRYAENYLGASNCFSGTTCEFNVKGNIMSLIRSTGFVTATTLESSFTFVALFQYCPGLIDASKLILPATTLKADCYYGMFQGCRNLTAAPELPATTLEGRCYGQMFSYCISLTTAPELPATTLAGNCYQSMFYGCTGLIKSPDILATSIGSNSFQQMFDGCTGLISAGTIGTPETVFTGNYACQSMFNGCTSLVAAPKLPIMNLGSSCYFQMFKGCAGLTKAPELPATTLASSCYYEMFLNCTGLTTAPSILPATALTYNCYYGMFNNCRSLTTTPVLPATALTESCYSNMFTNCTSLTAAPELPATVLASSCYTYMFSWCSNLVAAPILPATTLTNDCYYFMFTNCTKLNYIKCLATDISATDCTKDWVNGVASAGTFVKDANMSSWTTGYSGIPNNWTVQDAS